MYIFVFASALSQFFAFAFVCTGRGQAGRFLKLCFCVACLRACVLAIFPDVGVQVH